jgi:hypothetical protein
MKTPTESGDEEEKFWRFKVEDVEIFSSPS